MLAVAGANTAGTEARSPSWEMPCSFLLDDDDYDGEMLGSFHLDDDDDDDDVLCSFLLDDDDDDVMLCSFVNDDDDQMLCSFLLDHDHESYQMLWSLC